MKKLFGKIMQVLNHRTLVLSFVVIVVAMVLIAKLFELQIVNGETYREQSEKRMLRSETIVAPRGEIVDTNGVILAMSKRSFDVDLYRVSVENAEQNAAIAKLIQILESNGDSIYSTFPINSEHTAFDFESQEAEKKWKKEMKLEENLTFDQTINSFIEKYKLQEYGQDRTLQIKMVMVKYEGVLNGYSLFRSATIAKDISEKSVAQLDERRNELLGVKVDSVPKRYYPYANLFSHVLGYTSKISSSEYDKVKDTDQGYTQNSIIGKAGVEQSFENYLKGTDGVRKVETDTRGNVSSETISKEAKSGDTVKLTIDFRLQKVAQEALESTIQGLQNGTIPFNKKPIKDAKSGSVVVLDVNSGEVLAMVNYPNYDTNSLVGNISTKDWNALLNDPLRPMFNRAISGTYSPGSTYKMLVGLAGLQTKNITVDEKYLDPGIYPYGYHPRCWLYSDRGATHGWINISGAIKGSCNCYFYDVGRRMGIADIVNYSKLFGLGQKTGIELSQEATGQIAGDTKDPWYLGDTLSAAIGQSYNSYTPIQLANYIATIANGGNLNKVSLIKEIKDDTNSQSVSLADIEAHAKEITGVDFEPKKLDIDSKYIDAIKEGMLSVTNDVGGTAQIVFKNSNIKVAGKTGTSQVTSGSNNGIFVGFAPYDKPKIAVVAVIEHGDEGTYTANVVKPIMEEYFKISTENKSNEKEQNAVKEKISF